MTAEIVALKKINAELATKEIAYNKSLSDIEAEVFKLIDYRNQFNKAGYEERDRRIAQLTKELSTEFTKYEKFKIDLETRLTADMGAELYRVKSILSRKDEYIEHRLLEIEQLTAALEELEMRQSNNNLEVKEVQRHYRVLVSQLKSENEELHKKYQLKID